ncbi:MAG: ankyrin repeat domain-containing protein [Spirochaetaceae bacterium]|nr:ankyrin repeat domain-containing protein [Spirochaetaceae bacterium]
MRRFAFIILFSTTLFSICGEEGVWPFDSSYWETVTIEELVMISETEIEIDAEDQGGYTALLYGAGLSNDPEVITFLLEKEAEIDKRAGSQWTPLMFAVSSNNNPEISRRLIEGGADVNAVDSRGYTVLMTAASWCGNPEIIKILLDAGADVQTRNPYSHNTALMYAAAWNQSPEITGLLLEYGSNRETRDNEGRTALMLSAEMNQNPAVFFRLMANKADISKRDIAGRTLLMLASAGYNPEIVESLYNKGVELEAYDAEGRSVWDYISQNENMKGSDIYWVMNDLYYDGKWQLAPPIENEPENDAESVPELNELPELPSTGILTTDSLLKILTD